MGIFGDKKGVRCESLPDGTQKCRIYKASKGEKLATGTEFDIVLDENCNPQYPKGIDVLEEDEQMVKHVVNDMVASCRKGIR